MSTPLDTAQPSALAQEQQALDEIDVLLNQNRPKHLVEGVTSGLGYIVAGAVGAAGILVLSPKVGADAGREKSGALGAAVGGLLGGVIGAGSAVSVAAGGLLSGVGQILRGLVNTPNCIIQPRQGKWWSIYEGIWVKTHLKSEKEWIETQPEYDEDILGEEVVPEDVRMERLPVDEAAQRAKRYDVKETDLYDTLGVDPDATTDDIKRRYAQLGKLFNPNRQGADNPAAAERFRKIGNAYVILTNPQFRQRYDEFGTEGIYGKPVDDDDKEDEPLVNPIELYGVIYGSEKFGPFIGRLAAASEAMVGTAKSSSITLVEARLLQKRRVTRLALQLAGRLKEWVNGDEDGARADWDAQARDLCDSFYGVQLVKLIGSVYSLSAAQFLGSFDSGIGMPSISKWAEKQMLGWKQTSSMTATKIEQFAGDVKATSLKHKAASTLISAEATGKRDSVAEELYESIGRDVLEMLWTRTAVDVTNTIHETAQMVLFDMDLNDDTRKRRAEGLEALGQMFQEVKYDQSESTKDGQADYEKIAFYAVLDTIRRTEIASRNADLEL